MSHWRPALSSDEDPLVTMFESLNREDPGQAPVPPGNMRHTLRMLREQPARGRVLVLDDAGACRGYALLIAFWSNELGGECCTIDELYVAPEARGRGHGAALIRALASGDHFSADAVALVLEVSPKNTRALSLYRRLGFQGENLALRLPLRR
jgi:ribosomal protein S18 acetylase RimI-like enzyme